MKHELRSATCTQGRRMAGARALWRANGMKEEQIGRPVIAVVNSFTQFVPGHVHLHEIGQIVKSEIEKFGCFAAEFDTIAIDDGIAMGHTGMKYSLVTRDLIADSILDEALRQDSKSHMAVEATIKDDLILVYGEAGTNAVIDYEKIAHTFRSSVFSAFFLYFSFLVFYFTFCSGVCKRGGEWFRMAVDWPCIF